MRFTQGGAGALTVLLLTLAGCASSEFAAVNREPGFYYGYGTGATEAAAQDSAVLDLVYNTFVETGSIKKEPKVRVNLTPEMKAVVAPLAPKPFNAEKKSETSFSAVYRIKYADWTKSETPRLAQLQADLGGRFDALTTDAKTPVGDRMVKAYKLIQDIERQGVPLSLRVGGTDTALLADSVTQWVRNQAGGASFALAPANGPIDAGQPVTVTLADKTGRPLSGFPVSAVWFTDLTSAPALVLVTDAKGSFTVPYPTDPAFRNVRSTLKVNTRINSLVPGVALFAGLDAPIKADGAYRNTVILANLKTEEVRVEGGTFTIGSVKQDRRAGSNERPRTVAVKTFFIDKQLVTNDQYLSYLVTNEIPKADWPDFLGGDLGGGDQPVVGITWAEAQKYAQWVSTVTGVAKRLPTEEEYEIAARAGQSVIYPWGDQPPADGVRAPYSGNKKFSSTAPVGSFENGANPLGLMDMVGNVWQWTTSSPDAQMSANPAFKLVKGGSWLDGPGDLRISNRRAVDPAESASDIGFRLVREEN